MFDYSTADLMPDRTADMCAFQLPDLRHTRVLAEFFDPARQIVAARTVFRTGGDVRTFHVLPG